MTMNGNGTVLQRFFHSWDWNKQEYSQAPVLFRDLVASRVSTSTGRNFSYESTRTFSNRSSQAAYKRIDIQIQAIDPITLSIIVSAVAGIFLALWKASKGEPVDVGFDAHTKSWYVNTGGHTINGDGGGSISIPPGEYVESQGSSNMIYIVMAVIGLALLYFLFKK